MGISMLPYPHSRSLSYIFVLAVLSQMTPLVAFVSQASQVMKHAHAQDAAYRAGLQQEEQQMPMSSDMLSVSASGVPSGVPMMGVSSDPLASYGYLPPIPPSATGQIGSEGTVVEPWFEAHVPSDGFPEVRQVGQLADVRPAPVAPKPPTHCAPQCFYRCEDVRCDEVCTPVCKPATCETRCKHVDLASCKEDCSTPQCRIDCPMRQCSSASCPHCETKCGRPKCLLKCPEEQPCSTVCEHPACSWKCHAPEKCPTPKCQMYCQHPPSCMAATFRAMPPMQLGEVKVQSFVVNPEEVSEWVKETVANAGNTSLLSIDMGIEAPKGGPEEDAAEMTVASHGDAMQTIQAVQPEAAMPGEEVAMN